MWHRRNIFELVNWDPFDDDPFIEMDLFHDHDLFFPSIHWARADYRKRVPQPLMTRNDKDNYQLSMDVKGFDPKELSLKLVGRELLIKGDHNCRPSQKEQCLEREFCWRRTLPEDVDLSPVKATLTELNILEIEANKNKPFESDIQIAVCDRPGDQTQHKPKNQFGHGQVIRKEPHQVEEEATVEIVPDETDQAIGS